MALTAINHRQTLIGGDTIAGEIVKMAGCLINNYSRVTLAFYNNLDVEVVVSFEGSDTSDFALAWLLAAPTLLTIPASGHYDYEVLSNQWNYVRPSVDPTGTATTGTFEYRLMAGN